jgi:hypothetical protein
MLRTHRASPLDLQIPPLLNIVLVRQSLLDREYAIPFYRISIIIFNGSYLGLLCVG